MNTSLHACPTPRSLPILLLLLMFLLPVALHAQNVIIHRSITYEDGEAGKDADGTRNGTVVWQGGAIHLVVSRLSISQGESLVIQPGAIVKFANSIEEVDGELRSFTPPSDAGLVSSGIDPETAGVIQIDGAILTDIRDDAVGGDSNKDGDATEPEDLRPNLMIRFSGGKRDYLRNSTIKYFDKIGHLGSIKITDNTFEEFGMITHVDGYPYPMSPIPENSSPILSGNTFSFRDNSGHVDLRGVSALVEDNRFLRGGYGAALHIGLRQEYGYQPEEQIYPLSGTTYVSHNIFETNGGVRADANNDSDSLFAKAGFHGVIRGNHFRPPAVTGEPAISVQLEADIEVVDNTVENHNNPLVIYLESSSNAATSSPLKINNNRFLFAPGRTFASPDISGIFSRTGVIVNAENNFWGDPSGPLDEKNTDGLFNPRGKGFKIGEGIDYRPFIGGTSADQRDRITISATATPSPLVPGAAATINVTIDRYDLLSAPTGKILVLLRDAAGYVINSPGTVVNITAQNRTATVPPIAITVPEITKSVAVEAYIGPDGDAGGIASNVVLLDVPQPPSKFDFLGAFDPVTGSPILFPTIMRGTTLDANVKFRYTHTTSNVNFEIELSERDATTGRVIQVLEQSSFSVPPGTNRQESKRFTLAIPMRDILQVPSSKLYGRFVARDDAGNIIGKVEGGLPIFAAANFITTKSVLPVGMVDGNLATLGRQFLLEGDQAAFRVRFDHAVGTPGVTDWQVWLGPIEILTGSSIIQTYAPAGPFVSNVSTGRATGDMVMRMPEGSPPIAVGGWKARVHLRLVKPQGNLTVATSYLELEIRPRPDQTVQHNAVAGAQTLSFNPIPVSLTFTSNQSAGAVTAMEFDGQFRGKPDKRSPSIQGFNIWKFIPINRYWAVFDTLKEGSFAATLAITYDPATDFPATPGFNEDSLVICGFNYYSMELEELPTVLDRNTRTLTTPYSKFFDTWVVASRSTEHVSTGVEDRSTIDSRPIAAFTSYPNPADGRATLRFELREPGPVELEIVNTLGEPVALLQSGWLAAGSHERVWNGEDLPGGVYLARLRGAAGERRLKIIRVR